MKVAKLTDAAIRKSLAEREAEEAFLEKLFDVRRRQKRWRWYRCRPLLALMYAVAALVFGVMIWAWALKGVVR
jgi:fatty acid desaturase